MTLRFAIYLLLLLTVFVSGLVNLKKLSRPFRLLTFLIGTTFLSELISRLLAYTIHNSIPVYHFFSPIEFLGIAGTYYYLITNIKVKQVIKWIMAMMVLLAIADTLWYEKIFIFPSKYLLLSEAYYLILSLYGFSQMLLHTIQTPLHRQSFFWLNTAMLIYTCTIFLNFGLHDYLIRIKVGTVMLNTLIYIVNIIFYAFIGVAIIADKNRQKHDQ